MSYSTHRLDGVPATMWPDNFASPVGQLPNETEEGFEHEVMLDDYGPYERGSAATAYQPVNGLSGRRRSAAYMEDIAIQTYEELFGISEMGELGELGRFRLGKAIRKATSSVAKKIIPRPIKKVVQAVPKINLRPPARPISKFKGFVKKEVNNAARDIKNAPSNLVKDVRNTVKYAAKDVRNFTSSVKQGIDRVGDTKLGKAFRKTRDGVLNTAGKVIRFLNRFVNPATMLIRNGWLLSCKVNLFGVSRMLRWGYVSAQEAQAKIGLDPGKHAELRDRLGKVETIYWQAGGSKANLKKAILNGKGNRDGKMSKDNAPIKEVNDQAELDLVATVDEEFNFTDNEMMGSYFMAQNPSPDYIRQKLMEMNQPGKEEEAYQVLVKMFNALEYLNKNEAMMQSILQVAGSKARPAVLKRAGELAKKNQVPTNGLGELGEPASATAIAAVSGAVATLVGALAPLFKGTRGAKPEKPIPTGDPKLDAMANQAYQAAKTLYNTNEGVHQINKAIAPRGNVQNPPTAPSGDSSMPDYALDQSTGSTYLNNSNPLMPTSAKENTPTVTDKEKEQSWMEKNKMAVGIGAGVLVIGGMAYAVSKNKKGIGKKQGAKKAKEGLSGTSKKRGRKKKTYSEVYYL